MSDTIGSRLASPFRVIVRDTNGLPIPGATVGFSGREANSPLSRTLSVSATGTTFQTTATVTAGGDGSAAVHVRFLDRAGPSWIIVSAPQHGLVDTVDFHVLPGNPVTFNITLTDTAVQVGDELMLSGGVLDRNGNVRFGEGTFTLDDAAVTMSAAHVLTATEPARVKIVGEYGAQRDSAFASFVPAAQMLIGGYAWGYDVTTLDLKRFVYGISPTIGGPRAEWRPDGMAMAVGDDFPYGRIYQFPRFGSRSLLVGPTEGIGPAVAVDYSPDGNWVYFEATPCGEDGILFRVRSTGGAVERVSPPAPTDCSGTKLRRPSVSPDGTQLAFQFDSLLPTGTGLDFVKSVRVLDLGTGQITRLTAGEWPRWSPAGGHIAFVRESRVWMMNADGSNERALTPPGHVYEPHTSWSPDGKWLLGIGRGMVVVIEPETGRTLPIPQSAGVEWASWRPITEP